MVTQYAHQPVYMLDSDNGPVASPSRRRVPPHLTPTSVNMTSTPSSSMPNSPTRYAPASPLAVAFHPSHPNEHHSPSSPISATSSHLQHQHHYHHNHHHHRAFARSPTPRSATPSTGHDDDSPAWPLPMTDAVPGVSTIPRMRQARPGLRISMSTNSLRSRRRSPHPDHNSAEMGYNNRPLPRFPPRVTPDLQYNDPLRSSQNSGKTSFSSYDQMSGTERSSVLTKSSSMTDLSPDHADGQLDGEDDMTVEDAIGMYLDDIIDVPEEPPVVHSELRTSDLDVIAEAVTSPVKTASIHNATHQREHSSTESTRHDKSTSHSRQSSRQSSQGAKSVTGRTSEALPSTESPDKDEKAEDVVEPHAPREDPPLSKESRRQNLSIDVSKIKKAVAENPDQPIPSPRYSTVIRVPGQVPPPFLSGNDGRDRYGFRKVSHQISLDQFESWNTVYASFAENRRQKWVKLLESSGLPSNSPVTFPPKSNLIKRYVRKGIPSEYRGAAWFYYAGGFDHMHPNPGHYSELVRRAMSTPSNTDKEHIERDLYRTFPDNIHFKPDMPAATAGDANGGASKHHSVIVETQMIRSLRRVLYAFALHNPRVGYTQSLNFITGLLLLFLPEEKAFWMLHIITSELLPATHEVSLEGANVDMWILMVLLRDNLPHVYTKIVSTNPTSSRSKAPALTVNTRLPDITLGLTNWLMSAFIGSLPLETTLRVWDCFFYEGSKTFFRVALGIFKAGEREILSVSDPMEVFQIVQTIPKRLLDANALLDESMSRKYRVGQGRIDALREQRREAVRQEKTRLSLLTGPAMGFSRPSTRSGARSPLPRLDGWRSLKKNTFH